MRTSLGCYYKLPLCPVTSRGFPMPIQVNIGPGKLKLISLISYNKTSCNQLIIYYHINTLPERGAGSKVYSSVREEDERLDLAPNEKYRKHTHRDKVNWNR